jgi:hypothetical protein
MILSNLKKSCAGDSRGDLRQSCGDSCDPQLLLFVPQANSQPADSFALLQPRTSHLATRQHCLTALRLHTKRNICTPLLVSRSEYKKMNTLWMCSAKQLHVMHKNITAVFGTNMTRAVSQHTQSIHKPYTNHCYWSAKPPRS